MYRKIFIFFVGVLYIGVKIMNATAPAYSTRRLQKLKTTQLTVSKGFSIPCIYDWDGDGVKDLVVGAGDGYIYFYKNYGTTSSPEFRSGEIILYKGKYIDEGGAPYIAMSNHSKKIAGTDFNGDGKPDLLVGQVGKIFIYYNDSPPGSTPVFNTRTNFSLPVNGSMPKTIDYNNDGKLDLILGVNDDYDYGGGTFVNKIYILTNSGTATNPDFSGSPIQIRTNGVLFDFQGEDYTWIKTDPDVFPCNWDNDGDLDLIVTYSGDVNYYPTGASGSFKTIFFWLEQISSNNFVFRGELTNSSGKSLNIGWQSTCFIDDWNNDGKPDIISGDLMGSVHLFLGTDEKTKMEIPSPSVFQSSEENDIYGAEGTQVVIEDFNSDGLLDVLTGCAYGLCYVFLNEGTSDSYLFKEAKVIVDENNRSICAYDYSYPNYFDWNNDEKKDLMLGTGMGGSIDMFKNIGSKENPIFSATPIALQAGGDTISTFYPGFQPGDFNNDGVMDLIDAEGSGQLYVYIAEGKDNNGNIITNSDGTISLKKGKVIKYSTGEILDVGQYPSDPFVVDFDGDGDNDILVAAEAQIHLLKNLKVLSNIITIDSKELVNADEVPIHAGQYAMLYVKDFNNDGWLDLFIANNTGNIFAYFGGTPRYLSADGPLMTEDTSYPFPNPVKSGNSVSIRYWVRDNSLVTIEIYTIDGRLIDEIKTEARFDMDNKYDYDISNLPNGTYIVKIKAKSSETGEEKTIIKKLVILK